MPKAEQPFLLNWSNATVVPTGRSDGSCLVIPGRVQIIQGELIDVSTAMELLAERGIKKGRRQLTLHLQKFESCVQPGGEGCKIYVSRTEFLTWLSKPH